MHPAGAPIARPREQRALGGQLQAGGSREDSPKEPWCRPAVGECTACCERTRRACRRESVTDHCHRHTARVCSRGGNGARFWTAVDLAIVPNQKSVIRSPLEKTNGSGAVLP